jgi:hypothetical protein
VPTGLAAKEHKDRKEIQTPKAPNVQPKLHLAAAFVPTGQPEMSQTQGVWVLAHGHPPSKTKSATLPRRRRGDESQIKTGKQSETPHVVSCKTELIPKYNFAV